VNLRSDSLLHWGLPTIALALLLGGSAWRLDSGAAGLAQLEAEVRRKQEALESYAERRDATAGGTEALATLEVCTALTEAPARRIAAISEAARLAGVELSALQGLTEEPRDGGRTRAVAQRVECCGSLRQVARFLDELGAARGLLALEELELVPAQDGESGVVQASLRVAWLCAAEPPEVAPEEGS
jgi:cell division protein FtsB